MKLPKFDPQAMLDLLLKHGEKLVVGLVAVVGAGLVWGGFDAVRSLSPTPGQQPDAVKRATDSARAHIEAQLKPPADLTPPRPPLAQDIDPWRAPLPPWKPGSGPALSIAAAPAAREFSRPLFAELAKRTAPTILPIEDLKAVAGVAILPAAPPAKRPGQAAGGGAPAMPPGAMPPGAVPPGRLPPGMLPPEAFAQMDPRRAGGSRPPPGRAGMPFPGGAPGGGPVAPPAAPAEDRRIQPYVIVTGLIPVEKQQLEYQRRFGAAGHRDPKRDSPRWCDYEIDRASVGPDGKEQWMKIDLAALARQRPNDVPVPGAPVPPQFLLVPNEEELLSRATPFPFCSPLPPRLDGSWDFADLHPWVVDRLQEALASLAPATETDQGEDDKTEPAAEEENVPFEGPQPAVAPPDNQGANPLQQAGSMEYRLFRFVDLAVEPGRAYRYRVRLKTWNPNFSKDETWKRRHLANPEIGVAPKLSSPDSQPSSVATVPDTKRLLVAALGRDEIAELKRFNPVAANQIEVLVLGPNEGGHDFALRGLVAEPGAVIDIDEKDNFKGKLDRARGTPVSTGRVLLDARGRQQDRRDGPAEKEKPPGAIPEPLDVICLRPDGGFEFAATADSAQRVEQYRATLPPRSRKVDAPPGGAPPGLQPGIDPLAGGRPGR